LSNFVGTDANGYGYYSDGSKYNGAGAVGYGSSWASVTTIGVAVDLDAGTLTFYKAGVSQGQAFSGLSGTFFAMLSTDGTANSGTINTGATPFAFSPPPGYSAWDATVYNAGIY